MEWVDDIEVWWPLLPESVRSVLQTDPGAALSGDTLTALVRTRGYGPAAAHWVESGPEAAQFILTSEEQEWIHAHTPRES